MVLSGFYPFFKRGAHRGEASLQIRNQIVHVLDSDREAYELFSNAHLLALFGANHGVGCDDRDGDQ